MRLERTIEGVRGAVREARRDGKTIGFVPTRGYLHEGHLSLVDLAHERTDFVVASIFVNPKQFGPSEDLATYPRDEARDRAVLESRGVDLLFAPDNPAVLYPPGFSTVVSVQGVSEPLEGERRPGHFDGVATVVLKLFNIVQPDVAIFGQKDAQQCAVIRRLVRDLDLPVEIVVGQTQRESDGLAMSSRNSYLSEDERANATVLHRALERGREELTRGADPASAESAMAARIREVDGVEVDYLHVVDPETFQTPAEGSEDLLLVGAVRIGRTRLIDNIKMSH